MPPKDVPASELFTKLLECPRPSEVFDFPRKDELGIPLGKIRMQVLTSPEHDRAREAAHAALKKKGYSIEELSAPTIKEVLGDAVAKEIIAMTSLTERNYGTEEKPSYGRIFRTALDLDVLTSDEILVLWNSYQLVQYKYGPIERNLDQDDFNAWIRRLGEGGAEFPLLRLALPQLVMLAQSLGERLCTLYRILESQREALPTSLASQLAAFSTDTGWFGTPADSSGPGGSDRSDRPLTELTTELAAELSANQRDMG